MENYWVIRPILLQYMRMKATLAQLAEHSIRNRKVVGSTPTGGSSVMIGGLVAAVFVFL